MYLPKKASFIDCVALDFTACIEVKPNLFIMNSAKSLSHFQSSVTRFTTSVISLSVSIIPFILQWVT